MKKIIFLVGIVLTGMAINTILSDREEVIMPLPTDVIVINEEDEGSHLEREKWIEEMHRTAPGVNWREIDNQTLERLRVSRTAARRMKSGQGPIQIGNGRLTGEWNEKGSHNQSGRMHCIDVDYENEHIYGASSGGQIWRGNLEGKNWISLSDHNQVKGIVFIRVMKNEANNTRIMMANNNGSFSGSKIFQYSDDDGQSWQGANGLRNYDGNHLVRAVTQPDGTIYLLFRKSGRSYILRSINYGEDFTAVDNKLSSAKVDIWTPRFDLDKIYFVDKNELFIINSEDEFEFVSEVNINFSANDIDKIQLNGCFTEEDTYLYCMYRLEKSTRFIQSADGGLSWSVKGQLNGGPFMSNSFGVSTNNPLLLGFGEVNAYRSVDGGANWILMNAWGEYYQDVPNKLHADVPEIEFFRKPDGGEQCFVSTDGGSYISTNGLSSVKNISLTGLHVSQYYSTYTHRENTDVIYAGSQDQGFQRTIENNDGVVNFEQTISGDYGHIVSGDGGKSIWTVYPGFAMRYPNAVSDNNIVTWDFTGDNHFWMPPLMEDPYFPDRVFLAGGTSTTGNHLWHLIHGQGGISAVELPYDFSAGTDARISAMAFSSINKDYRYVLNSAGKFFYSSDRGATWEKSSNRGPNPHYFYGNSVVADVNDINTIYLGGSGYSGSSVWVTRNGGSSFEKMSDGLPNTLVYDLAINDDGTLLFAATQVGPFVWIESENEWFDLSGGIAPEQTYWAVDYVPALRTARFGTYGRGIWDFKITEYTGMDKIFAHKESMGLNIYPNPVVNQANIEITLPIPGDLKLRIINGAGQQVREHIENNLPDGSYTYIFEAQSLSPGVYYVQAITGNRTTVRKLILQ